MAHGGCCICCSAFRPRYKKLVDHIFPANPEDGLVKSNMEKLLYYAMHSPDKLDRIGEYLALRLDRDMNRRRTGYVVISMDALDQLLCTCHANGLNLFVKSFLLMIQRLLESQEPMLQLRASQSFEKYAKIREEVPQYHRRYDFFVSKFASMCYYNESDCLMQNQMRTAGINGIQGVVQKTDYDDLGDNIWQSVHMDKIIPALLFNVQDGVQTEKALYDHVAEDSADHDQRPSKKPYELSETCLRDIIYRATAGKIAYVIRPLLIHMDQNDLWINNEFAVRIFKLVMYSIQVQNSVTVIKMLIAHLNENQTSLAKWRIGIADVLGKVIPIAAGECIGPSVIDIINSLLERIRASIISEKEQNAKGKPPSSVASDEQAYQETLIHALGEYANHLPDYQKIESMIFILNKVPGNDEAGDVEKSWSECEIRLQYLLLKSLLKVGTKYKTAQYSSTFSHSFLARLLQMSLSSDPEVRLTVQHILHTLIDRHDNASKLGNATIDVGVLKLSSGKLVRQDVNFWKKCGNDLLVSIVENCKFSNNKLENIESLYSTIMLLLTEIRHDDVVIDTVRVLFLIQNLATGSSEEQVQLSNCLRIQLMSLVGAVMVAVSHCITPLKEHVSAVVDKRSSKGVQFLPPLKNDYGSFVCDFTKLDSEMLFDFDAVLKVLKESEYDYRRLTASVSTVIRRPSVFRKQSGSLSDGHSQSVEVDSAVSSPEFTKKISDEVSFDALKNAFCDSAKIQNKLEEDRKQLIFEMFMRTSFETLVANAQNEEGVQFQLKRNFITPKSLLCSSYFNPNPDPTLNLVSPDAPYRLPYPDLLEY